MIKSMQCFKGWSSHTWKAGCELPYSKIFERFQSRIMAPWQWHTGDIKNHLVDDLLKEWEIFTGNCSHSPFFQTPVTSISHAKINQTSKISRQKSVHLWVPPACLDLNLSSHASRGKTGPPAFGAFGADESWWQREIFWEIPLKMSWNITEIEPWWRLNMSWRWIPILTFGNGLGNPNHLTRKHVRNSLFQQSCFSVGENSHHIKHRGDRRIAKNSHVGFVKIGCSKLDA